MPDRMSQHDCEHGIWIGACYDCKPIQVPKDQAWRNFHYTFKAGRTKEIHSQRQFHRECRKVGLVQTTRDDLMTNGTPSHPSRTPVDTRPIQETLKQISAESHNPQRVERKWRQLQAAGQVR